MKKRILTAVLCVTAGVALSACVSKRQQIKTLESADQLIEKSKDADCETIRLYLDNLQTAIRAALSDLKD